MEQSTEQLLLQHQSREFARNRKTVIDYQQTNNIKNYIGEL